MEQRYRRCCGLDVHKDSVVVCVLPVKDQPGKAIRKCYGTFRNDLIRLRIWLTQLRVTDIAIESTGVYSRPVWNVLDGHQFHLLLANPVQKRPGTQE
jgi:transposase